VILYFIFSRIDYKKAIGLITQIDSIYIWLLLVTITVIKFFTQVLNWSYCLEIFLEASSEFRRILKTHFIGLALRFFVPGGYATVGKMLYFEAENRKKVFFSILAEKFFGVWIIFFFVAAAYMIYPPSIENNGAGMFVTRLLLQLLGIFVILFPLLVPLLIRRYLGQQLFLNYISAMPKILVVQIVYIVLTFTQYYILLKFFTGELEFYKVALGVSLVLVSNVIPITYSGLGLREATSAWVLPSLAGIDIEVAVGVSLIIFFLNSVLPALPGIWFIIKKEPLLVGDHPE